MIKIFSDFSFIFALSFYFLSFIDEVKLPGFLYLLVSFIVPAAYAMKKRKSRWLYAIIALLPAFFAFAKNLADMIFISIIVSYSLYVIYKGLNEIGYYMAIERFQKGLMFFAAMFAIAIPTGSFGIIEAKSIPFIIIFLVTSVMLNRSMRLCQFNENTKELHKINLRYSMIIVGLSLMLSIKQVRQAMGSILHRLYDGFLELVIYLLYGVFLAVGYGLKYVIAFVRSLLERRVIKPEAMEESEFLFGNIEDLNGQDLISIISKSWIFNALAHIVSGILVLLLLYMAIKLLTRRFYEKREKEEYTETREFIKKDKEGKALGRLALPFNMRRYEEYIRYYYRKFLKLCISRDIEIKSSDTTLQINDKSTGEFDEEALHNMREAYIKVRYGEETADKQKAREFRKFFSKLKKS